MKHVSFEEYEAAKAEIIGGVQYKEQSTLEGNVIRKTYATEENGVFYEVNDGGRVEFWSDKHPESRIYDENERAATPGTTAQANTGAEQADKATTDITPEKAPSYGRLLHDKIRTETEDFNSLNDFEKFILDRGYLYDTEAELKAGYDRSWKARHGILVTAEEFAAEVKSRVKWDKALDTSELYETLVRLVQEKKLNPGEVFGYAVYTWCLRNPEAVVAYEEAPGKWLVNNCGTEISEDRARVEVCEEWGFEASRVKIIGTPYYDATDWQFIRFDCAHMTWLWANGNLYQVYG